MLPFSGAGASEMPLLSFRAPRVVVTNGLHAARVGGENLNANARIQTLGRARRRVDRVVMPVAAVVLQARSGQIRQYAPPSCPCFSRVYDWKWSSHTNESTPMATSAVIAAIRANETVTRVVYVKRLQIERRSSFSASSAVLPYEARSASSSVSFFERRSSRPMRSLLPLRALFPYDRTACRPPSRPSPTAQHRAPSASSDVSSLCTRNAKMRGRRNGRACLRVAYAFVGSSKR